MKQGRKDGAVELDTTVGMWLNPQNCPLEGREAGALVPQLFPPLAGGCLPGWDTPVGRSSALLDSRGSPKAEGH